MYKLNLLQKNVRLLSAKYNERLWTLTKVTNLLWVCYALWFGVNGSTVLFLMQSAGVISLSTSLIATEDVIYSVMMSRRFAIINKAHNNGGVVYLRFTEFKNVLQVELSNETGDYAASIAGVRDFKNLIINLKYNVSELI